MRLGYPWWITGLILAAALPACAQPTEITSGLTFYASFDKSLAPDNFAGISESSGDYRPEIGRVGKGFFNQGPGAGYGCEGNFTQQQGALSFWFKPEAALTRDGSLFSAEWFEIALFRGKQTLFFMTGSTPGGDFKWDYSLSVPLSRFVPQRWTHVAATWGTKPDGKAFKALYLNGKPAGSEPIDPIGDKDAWGFHFGKSCPGVYDELMIWDRPLPESDVARLCAEPEKVAQVVRRLPPMVKKKIWRVYPDLVYRNFTDSLISPGEPFSIQVPLTNRTDRTQTGTLELTLLDLWEKPVGNVTKIPFTLSPKQAASYPATFSVSKYGVYKVQAAVRIGDRQDARDITSFGCIPPGNPPKHPFFGSHIQQHPNEPEMARRLGFSANRSHNMTQYTWWRCMEYERGQWTMVQRGFYDKINELGMDHLGQWFAAPYWAVTLPDGKHPDPVPLDGYPAGWVPTDMEAYKTYVRESIKRYPAIREWEIWNEPACSLFWLGSPQDYVNLCKVTYETAKSTRPDVRIFAQYVNSVWGKAALKAGLLNYCDGLTYHSYIGTDRWDTCIRNIREDRKLIAKYTKKNVPLMNSECGILGTTFLRGLDFPSLPPESKRAPMDFRLVAERIVQYFVTTMAEGVERFYYYYHTLGDPYRDWNTIEVTKTPKPFAVALCMLIWQLDGGTYAEHLELAGPLHAYLFDRKDGQSTAVLWTVDEGLVDLKHPGTFFDLMGNPVENPGTVRVTPAPMYLRFAGKSAQLAQSLKTAAITVVKPPVAREETVAEEYKPMEMNDFSVALELGENRLIPLDLRSAANMGLADEKPNDGAGGWTDEGPFNDMRDLKPGKHTWLGVPIVVIDPAQNNGKAVFTLRGTTLAAGPASSPPIPVDKKVRGLFFAHAANLATDTGAKAGEYEILYADGTKETVPIVVGTNVFNWWDDRQDDEDSRTVPIKTTQPLEEGRPYRFIRLWYWENPRHDVPIQSIILKNDQRKGPTVVLVGITAALWNEP